ncbi:MAG TPA: GYD domain-containing protein [Azonexus sp.]|nr:GYD domain-containing protein [Azonexus sp.]
MHNAIHAPGGGASRSLNSPGELAIDGNPIQKRRQIMATFITLVNFTDQGIRNIKESPDRFEAFKIAAEKIGVTVKSAFYTVGQHDMALIVEGEEVAATALLLKVGSLGNVRTQTLRAFSVDAMRQIIGQMP